MHHIWYFFFLHCTPSPHRQSKSAKSKAPQVTQPPDSISMLLPTLFLLAVAEAQVPVVIPVPVWLGGGLVIVLVGVTFTNHDQIRQHRLVTGIRGAYTNKHTIRIVSIRISDVWAGYIVVC